VNELLRLHWRRELSYVGLVLMECCWLYPWASALTGRQAARPYLPFAALVCTLLLALYLTRLLELGTPRVWLQRLLTVSVALLSTLLLLRLYLYGEYRPGDLSWTFRFVGELGTVLERVPRALIIFALGLYLWWRGISLAQRELGIDSAGLSFRIGILALLWLPAMGMFGARIEATRFAFAYFGFGVIVMGLARVHDVSESLEGIRSPFDASWLAILTGAALLVSLLSVIAAWLLSLRTLAALVSRLGPLWRFLGTLLAPVAAVLAWLLALVFDVLVGLFARLFQSSEKQLSVVDRVAQRLQALLPSWQAAGGAPQLLQVLKWVALGLLLTGALAVLAFSVGRRKRERRGARSAECASFSGDQAGDQSPDRGRQDRLRRLEAGLLAALSSLQDSRNAILTIRQIYARLARLAADIGSPRREAQTPYEYLDDLRRAFPDSPGEVQLITEAYVAAHYGQRSFPSEYLQRVREAWQNIRKRHEHARAA